MACRSINRYLNGCRPDLRVTNPAARCPSRLVNARIGKNCCPEKIFDQFLESRLMAASVVDPLKTISPSRAISSLISVRARKEAHHYKGSPGPMAQLRS